MKSERRHELKTNTLAQVMTDFPGFMREYGSQILLVLLICALIAVLVTRWVGGRSERDVQSREALTTARLSLNQLHDAIQRLAMAAPYQMPSGDAIASFRDQKTKEADAALATALASADPHVKAEAHVVRGDLLTLLASFPDLPGSETRPSLNGDRTRNELLKSAQEAYERVLQSPLSEDHTALRNARFGLAMIAEDNHEWDKARQFYQQIIDDPTTPDPFKDEAKDRLNNLANIEKPMLLATPEAPATSPTGPLGPMFPEIAPHPATSPSTSAAAATSESEAPTTGPTATQPASSQPASTTKP